MTELAKLKKQLDTVFSIYIRMKYADDDLYVKCFTCDTVLKYDKGMQNGHFYSRNLLSLRFNEMNCRPQCVGCNMFKKGNYIEYYRRLEAEIGKGGMDYLYHLSKQSIKLTRADYQELIEKYEAKTLAL
jgi:hypothetical protein